MIESNHPAHELTMMQDLQTENINNSNVKKGKLPPNPHISRKQFENQLNQDSGQMEEENQMKQTAMFL